MTTTNERPKTSNGSKPHSIVTTVPSDFQWQCVAWCQGRLKRSKPDEKGNRQLFFQCTDGTLLDVFMVGRDDNDSILWILTHIEECFNADNVWLLYPKEFGRQSGVVPTAIVKGKQKPVDVLQFSASVGNIDLKSRPGILPLFVGRNMGKGFHFCNLTIPEGFDLPELSKGTLVQGKATRSGNTWMLSELVIWASPSLGEEAHHEKEI